MCLALEKYSLFRSLKCVFVLIGVCSVLFLITLKICAAFLNSDEYDVWLTTGDQSKKMSREQPIGVTSSHHGYSVWVDRNKRRQTIEGFGAALTNSAAYNLFHSKIRDQIMTDLFSSSGLGKYALEGWSQVFLYYYLEGVLYIVFYQINEDHIDVMRTINVKQRYKVKDCLYNVSSVHVPVSILILSQRVQHSRCNT